MGNNLNTTVGAYSQVQHTTGGKLIALAELVRKAERKGLILSLVKGVFTFVSTVATGAGLGSLAALASHALTEEDKNKFENELREAEHLLQDLFNETKKLVRVINRNVHKNHHIKFSEETVNIPRDCYKKYNKRVRRSVDTLNVTLDAARLSRSKGVTGEGIGMALKKGIDPSTRSKWSLLQAIIVDILVHVVREVSGTSVSAKLEEIGNTLKRSA